MPPGPGPGEGAVSGRGRWRGRPLGEQVGELQLEVRGRGRQLDCRMPFLGVGESVQGRRLGGRCGVGGGWQV